ncbi:hypothetical protein [Pseudotamlana carrageenivorans]|uniref:Uncharacterized protein n=1 Tax=Pseudotamlana carrageenivorans TaxID=2069432 RepID=A0A2I7SGB9_9FLAO|nr:hypothetical protein [Tamlana carrageenivorans]AUS04920.1 hypothetical protein C1A40_05300 [Tamlana carrageenivorans]
MILQALILLLCFSCGTPQKDGDSQTKQEQVDEFYTSPRDGDLFRIPLVKPVQVISTIGYGDSWMVKLPYQQINRKRSVEARSITVIDSIIIIDAGIVSLPGENTQAWFFIDTKNQKEFVCRNEDEYQKKLTEIGVASAVLYDVNEVYSQFKEKGTLPFR